MDKGVAIIVSGPSGCGKDTILRNLFKEHPEIKFSISTVTRPRRGIADEDAKYHFVTRDEFESMLKNDELLEYNVYVNNYYGTPKKPVVEAIENGDIMVIEVDVNGAASIRKKMPGIKSVFVMPPSIEELERRLSSRGTDSAEVVKKRIDEARAEIVRKDEYDYTIVNGVLENAVNELYNIMYSSTSYTKAYNTKAFKFDNQNHYSSGNNSCRK